MNSYVLGFQEIDKIKLAMVGGKGANLGELSRLKGIQVPEGFCVTTKAYKVIDLDETLSWTIYYMAGELAKLYGNPQNLSVGELCERMNARGESVVMPANVPHALAAKERFKMLLTFIKLPA